MSSTKCDFGFSSQNFDRIPFQNKTIYKDTVNKNPFKQTNNDFFTTKISFKDIGMKYETKVIEIKSTADSLTCFLAFELEFSEYLFL